MAKIITPVLDGVLWEVHRGAPEPFAVTFQDDEDLWIAADPTITVRVTPEDAAYAAPFTLAVGSGITISDFDTAEEGGTQGVVAGGQATIQLTAAQSRLIKPGRFTRFEMQYGATGFERSLGMGFVIGKGGDNSGE